MSRSGHSRAAIVGTGAIANAHAEALAAIGVDLVAVVDHSVERAREFAGRWGGPAVYPSLEALIDSGVADVLHVCTPPAPHAELTIAALAAGLHVVCEKPAALSLAELDAMTDAAERYDRRLAIVFQQRSGTAAAHVRHLIDSNALGRPLVATCQTLWYRDPEYFAVPWRGKWGTEGGGPTLGLGIHQIDLLAWLLGEWSTVQGQMWRLDRDTEMEDVSAGVITFERGTVASVVTSALSPRQTSSIRIDTELATVTVDHVYGHSRDNWTITPAPGVPEETVAGWVFPQEDEGSGHVPLMRDVYEAITSGRELSPLLEAPTRSFEIVTALYSSATSAAIVRRGSLRDDTDRVTSLRSPIATTPGY
jgi:predicted dehydrogenase